MKKILYIDMDNVLVDFRSACLLSLMVFVTNSVWIL